MKLSRDDIKRHYQDATVARPYVDNRFVEPMGLLKHRVQVGLINDVLSRLKKPVVLDLACGPGRVSKDLRGVHKGFAADSSPEMLRVAKEVLEKNWTIHEIDAFDLPFTPSQFDVVTSFRFVRHFTFPDRERIYAQVKNILKKDGYFILDVLNKKTTRWLKLVGKHKYTVYDELYSKRAFVEEMDTAGFRVTRMVPVIRHVFLQGAISKMSHALGIPHAGVKLVNGLEHIQGGGSWEWIAICQKK